MAERAITWWKDGRVTGTDVGARLNATEVLELLPQQEPFRFVDEIPEVD